jgi:hypothetical protein
MSALWVVVTWVGCALVGALFTWIGASHGCQLDEGGAHPCIVFGVDVGEELSFLSVGLLLLVSFGLPLFLLALVGCLALAGLQFLVYKHKKRRL